MPHSTEISQYAYVPETKEDLDWADRMWKPPEYQQI